MRAAIVDFRIAEVFTESRLWDDDHREQMYWRRDGCPLLPGFYVVNWPPPAVAGRYNEDAVFRGPFNDRHAAAAAARRLLALADAGDHSAARCQDSGAVPDVPGSSRTQGPGSS